MIEPTEADIGRKVVYKRDYGPRKGEILEEGIITSFNESFVFVRYGSDAWSKSTYRRHLEWSNP